MSGAGRTGVLVVGDVNPDIAVRSPGAPRFDQVEQLVDGIDVTLGGSAGIVACGLARLGMAATLVAAVGDDSWGRWCADQLAAHGVATQMRTVGAATGATVLLLRESGTDRAILTALGAIPRLRSADIGDALLAAHRHLHICSVFLAGGLRPGLPDLCARARRAGLRISLDPNYDPSGEWDLGGDLLAAVDVLLVNATEARALAGSDDIDKAARMLAERCPAVVVKDGPRGAVVARAAGLTRLSAPEVAVVDTVGAGDSLAAGLVYGVTAGLALAEAAALGVACGTASVRAAGGTTGQPSAAEAAALARSVRVVGEP